MSSSSEIGYKSIAKPETPGSDFNAISFLVRQILSQANSSMLVQVKSVTNTGGVEPVGFVDVSPMVHMLDGYGHPIEHVTIYHIPYFRLQGGNNAVIIDPQVDDIGIAVFADKDISSVKNNKRASNPGSSRRNDMADGLYMGGFLNVVPTQYFRFSSGGVDLVTPAGKTVNIGATGDTLRALVTDLFITLFNAHTHTVTGAVTSSPVIPASALQTTTTVKAG